MRPRATVVSFLLVFIGFYSTTSFVAPEWTRRTGLDFWNYSKERGWIRVQEARNQDLRSKKDQLLRRDAFCDQIALSVCERCTSLPEALGDLAALAESDPQWWTGLRNQYRSLGIPLSASDREALTLLLRRRIELLLTRAERSGDAARVTLATARLTAFDEEIRELEREGTIAQAKP